MSEAEQIEKYLQRRLLPTEQLLMEAQLLIDGGLNEKARWQQRTYALAAAYGRMQLKKEIEAAQARVFSETRFEAFRKGIRRIFQ